MGFLYISNAFSPSMLDYKTGKPITLYFSQKTLDEVIDVLGRADMRFVRCVIGHESTAKLFYELTKSVWDKRGEKPECRRLMVTGMSHGDRMIVFALTFRPPEGKIYKYNELKELYNDGKIKFYMIVVGLDADLRWLGAKELAEIVYPQGR